MKWKKSSSHENNSIESRVTPLTIKPLKSLLGIDRCTDACDQVLKGSFDYKSLNFTPLQISYIKELKKHSGILKSPSTNSISLENI